MKFEQEIQLHPPPHGGADCNIRDVFEQHPDVELHPPLHDGGDCNVSDANEIISFASSLHPPRHDGGDCNKMLNGKSVAGNRRYTLLATMEATATRLRFIYAPAVTPARVACRKSNLAQKRGEVCEQADHPRRVE